MTDERIQNQDDRGLATRLLLAGLLLVALVTFVWWTFLRPHQIDIARPAPSPAPPASKGPSWSPWETPVAASVVALSAGDLDGDGRSDVVACCANGDVLALSGLDGSLRWSFETKSVPTPPSIADVDGDGRLDVLVGTKDGRALSFAGDGNVLWIHRFHEPVFQVAAADIDKDGAEDAAIAYPRGVKVLSGRTASQIALLEYARPGEVHIALADLDEDGTTDWVANYREAEFNTRGISGRDGSSLWMRQTGREVLSTPAFGACDGKTSCYYASEPQGAVFVFQGSTGGELRRWEAAGIREIAPEVEDVDRDGTLDVFVSCTNEVRVLSGRDGSTMWSSPTTGLPPLVADLEGDGTHECLIVDDTGVAIRSARDGSVLSRLDMAERLLVRPAVADLDGDTRLEVIVAVEGRVRSLSVPRK